MIGKTALRKLKTVCDMDPRVRAASLRAWSIVPFVELGLRSVTLQTLCRALGLRLAGADGTGQPSSDTVRVDSEELTRARRAAERALRNWGAPENCLRQALVTGYLLQARAPWLELGARRQQRGWEAHAWLRVGSQRVDSSAEGSTFHPLRARLTQSL